MYKSANPSALRSQGEILSAFRKLLEEETYDEISVKQLIYESKVARKTFYRNFTSKEDVLRSAIEAVITEYSATLRLGKVITMKEILETAFDFLEKYKDFFLLLKRDRLMAFVLEVINTEISKEHFSISSGTSAFSTYLVYFNIGAMFNVLNLYLEEDCKADKEKLISFLEEYIRSGISSDVRVL